MGLRPTNIEKFFSGDQEILLDRPRFRHFMNGRVVMGYVVNAATGDIARDLTMIPTDAIERHCQMALNEEEGRLEEVGDGPAAWSAQ